jgi:putative endonuclease
MTSRSYYTYITASRSRTLYIGITSNIERRMLQHKRKAFAGFTASYRCNRLVWFERYATPGEAIAREKQLKGWIRSKKPNLINQTNPAWIDLSEDWGKPLKSNPPKLSS